jgi:hypothetical protein
VACDWPRPRHVADRHWGPTAAGEPVRPSGGQRQAEARYRKPCSGDERAGKQANPRVRCEARNSEISRGRDVNLSEAREPQRNSPERKAFQNRIEDTLAIAVVCGGVSADKWTRPPRPPDGMTTAEAGWLDAMRASTTGRGGSRLDPKTSENRCGSHLLMMNIVMRWTIGAVEARCCVTTFEFAKSSWLERNWCRSRAKEKRTIR